MDNALATLFYPFEEGLITDFDISGVAVGFLNARDHDGLKNFDSAAFFLQQHFKPFAMVLQAQGFSVVSSLDENHPSRDVVMILLPKNAVEAEYLIARGLGLLKQDGLLICAADNKAGGSRIQKWLKQFGLKDLREESKNKARVVWGIKGGIDESALATALTKGTEQEILNGEYISMPGVFGWDKIDQGSKILTQYLPSDLSGAGADFGCGYGYLTRHVLETCTSVTNFTAIDADFRAVQLCQKNIEVVGTNAQTRFFWEDLTQPLPSLRDLDFIVMNPPFHEGKKTDSDIGSAFIETAHHSLAPDGQLWLVANVHLPYEEVLSSLFKQQEKIYEGEGFKIFRAIK